MTLADQIRALKRAPDAYEADERWNAALDRAAALADAHEAEWDACLRNPVAAREAALRAEVKRLGREVNIARYGEPDFAWAVHMDAMSDMENKVARLEDERDRLRAQLHAALDQAASLADEHAATLDRIKAEARREGMREAYDLCKKVRKGAETDDYGIGALDCAIAIRAAAGEADNG